MVVGRFPFAVPVTSTAASWLPLTKPLVIVGGEALDFALTITRATGNAAAIPGDTGRRSIYQRFGHPPAVCLLGCTAEVICASPSCDDTIDREERCETDPLAGR